MKLLLVPSACLLALPAAAADPPQELDRVDIAGAVYRVLDARRIPGAVVGVVVGEELVFHEAFGDADIEEGLPMEPDSLLQIGSATKSMTATLLAMLKDEGLLSFDDPLEMHWPEEHELPDAIGALTLRQLATHTSGLPRDPINRRNLPDSPSVPYPYSLEELYAGLAQTELVHAPGARWSYSSLGYAILGHVLEQVSGKPYEALLHERLLDPLGMSSTGIHPNPAHEKRMARHYWTRDDPRVARDRYRWGDVTAHGGVYSSVPDLGRYLAWQMSDDTELGLSPAMRQEMRTALLPLEEGSSDSMSVGWFVYDLGGVTLIGHDGEVDGQSASLAFEPQRRVGIIVLANTGRDAAPFLAQTVLRQVKHLVR